MTRDEIMDRMVPVSRTLFEADGSLTSTFLAFDENDSMLLIAAPWTSENEKAIMLGMIKKHFEENGVEAYALVSEIWMRSFAPDRMPPPGVMVSDYEDREEAVQIMVVDRNGVDVRIYPIERPTDGPARMSLEPRPAPPGAVFGGRMTELLSG